MRLRFSRKEPAIWLAHLDMMRTFERAVRRAELPIAYSQGFNPRPRMTFALPIGIGLATEDDYCDLYLTREISPDAVIAGLNEKLPAGLGILRAALLEEKGKSLMSLVAAAEYEIAGRGVADALQKLQSLPENQPWEIVKTSKKGDRKIDIKPLLLEKEICEPDKIRILVQAGSSNNLRPDLLLAFLSQNCDLDDLAARDVAITRTRLLIAKNGVLESPLP